LPCAAFRTQRINDNAAAAAFGAGHHLLQADAALPFTLHKRALLPHFMQARGFVPALAAVPWQASQINRVCAPGATKRVNRPLIYVIARTAHLTQFTFILDYWLGHRR